MGMFLIATSVYSRGKTEANQVDAEINDKSCRIEIDSGAGVVVISEQVFNNL